MLAIVFIGSYVSMALLIGLVHLMLDHHLVSRLVDLSEFVRCFSLDILLICLLLNLSSRLSRLSSDVY
jgi:hypothetical protein